MLLWDIVMIAGDDTWYVVLSDLVIPVAKLSKSNNSATPK